MADKLGVLKGIIGEELYNKVLDAVGKKEGEAEVAKLTAKEAKDEKAAQTAADDEKAEIDPKTGKPKKPATAAAQAEEDAEDKKKEAGDEQPDEALVAIFTKVVTDANTALVERLDKLESTRVQDRKEFDEAVTKRFGVIEASIKEAKEGVSELLGDMPKAVRRASESEKTVTDKAKALGEKGAGPQQDPEAYDFFSDFLMAQPK